MSENKTPDVLPSWANQTLILLWLLLFGGRWLLPPILQMAGVLSAQQLAALDEFILLKLYLVLLAVTCIVVALRAVRDAQSGTGAVQAISVTPDFGVPVPTEIALHADASDLSPQGATHTEVHSDLQEADESTTVAPAGGDETRD